MTNGEKFLKDYYPNSTITRDSLTGRVFVNEDNADFTLPIEWWDAEYKEPNLCDSCTNVGCEFQSGIVRTKCAFYIPPQIEPDNCGNYVVQDSTTKNDLGVDCVSRILVQSAISKSIEYKENPYQLYKRIERLPSVTPQEPRKGHLSIDDVMSVFDDFMCGEVDEDGTETFLEMLIDKADMREVEE